jgi:glutathione S-transferase
MTDVTVYGPPQSTFVRSARLTLAEKGVDYALEPVEMKQPSHLALHPFGRVPAFRHGDFHLYESSAIMAYVDGAFEGPALVPGDARERARMIQWMSAVGSYFDADITRRYIIETVFPKDGERNMERITAALVDVRHRLGIAEAALADAPFLAGDALSLADLMLLPIVFYVSRMPEGDELMGEHPALAKWLAAMSERPSFAATLPPPPPDQVAA